MTEHPVIVWFRSDLRLADHPALHAAAKSGKPVLPVFVWSPEEENPWAPGSASRWWLHHSLEALGISLRALGAELILRKGDSQQELIDLMRESGADAIYWNRRYDPEIIARDKRMEKTFRSRKVEVKTFMGDLLFEPWEIKNRQGAAYKVFTPFWNELQARAPFREPLSKPGKLKPVTKAPAGVALESLRLQPRVDWAAAFFRDWVPGEAGARKNLQSFSGKAVERYDDRRDLPAERGTSRLSAHLRFGEITPRFIYKKLGSKKKALSYLRQIGWREFAFHLLYHFPHTPRNNLNYAFHHFEWKENSADYRAWCRGETGYPIVDAGMRELWATGWMHNRVRMIAGSFLVKDLLIPWQRGAQWFWDTLVDADLANNTMGWQWVAGTGADAAPYFRIFNPVTQSRKFDARGAYIRRWIPELGKLPDKWVHEPWEAPVNVLKEAGVELDRDYPQPVVDHAFARRRALMAYEKMKALKAPAPVKK